MAIRIPTTDQSKIFLGSQEIGAVYVGANKVWPDAPAQETVVIAGETYNVITVGLQKWLGRNLHYNDFNGGILSYGNSSSNSDINGYLYNQTAALRIASLVPGWHLPSQGEFNALISGLSSSAFALREIGTSHWTTNSGTDAIGFKAYGAGYGYKTSFYELRERTFFRTQTPSGSFDGYYYLNLVYNGSSVSWSGGTNSGTKYYMSVRLIKD